MGVLSDRQIKSQQINRIISPFCETQKREGLISYGLSSYGYDMRLGYNFKIFTPTYCTVIDPKQFDPKAFTEIKLDPDIQPPDNYVLIPPNSFALAESLERFWVPRSTLGIVLGKSTYARCSLVVNCTPMEPEWEGILTIELSNTSPLPIKVYAGEGIAQVYFLRSDDPENCETSYADRKGKYQGQTELTLPKI